jgi:hypothetical protein
VGNARARIVQSLPHLGPEPGIVGPRPKLPEHLVSDFPCRPGITGAATIAFAREETILDRVPRRQLNAYYHQVVLPANAAGRIQQDETFGLSGPCPRWRPDCPATVRALKNLSVC